MTNSGRSIVSEVRITPSGSSLPGDTSPRLKRAGYESLAKFQRESVTATDRGFRSGVGTASGRLVCHLSVQQPPPGVASITLRTYHFDHDAARGNADRARAGRHRCHPRELRKGDRR